MQSELSEALEEYRAHRGLNEIWYEDNGKPCGIPIELADFIIRVGDFSAQHSLGMYEVSYNYGTDFESALSRANYYVSQAFVRGEKSGPNSDVGAFLDQAVAAVVAMCKANDINIAEALEIKARYNETRPHLHGGKKA